MGFENGYVKVFRQIEKWEWYTDSNTFRVFLHLLLNANFRTVRFQGEEIEQGATATTYQKIADKLGISKSQARTSIEHLKITGEITVRIARRFIIVYVQNWAKYQGDDGEERTQNSTQERTQIAPTIPETSHPNRTLIEEESKEGKEKKNKDTKSIVLPHPSRVFTKPLFEEVEAYCTERKNGVDPQTFLDFYESKGWMIGKNQMKDWKAAVRTWERGRNNDSRINPKKPDVHVDWLGKYLEETEKGA